MSSSELENLAADGALRAFASYRPLQVIGRGGMGTVFEAEHVPFGTRVALKVMNGSLAGDDIAKQRFLREAKAIAKVRHRHIVSLLDAGLDAGRLFVVMELLEGELLTQLLARERCLPLRRIQELFLPLFSAVAAIHDAGIVHRDLKPSNVILARRQARVDPVVLDFGISRVEELASEETNLTCSAGILGTPRYLSPEQVRNAKGASARSDQYALGVMLYECATGQKPFSGGSPYEVMHAVLTQRVPPPSAYVHDLPPAFDALVLRAMHRDPGARFADVRALGSALLSLGSEEDWSGFAREFSQIDDSGERTEQDGQERFEFQRPRASVRRRSSPARPAGGRPVPLLLATGVAACVAFALGAASPAFSPEREAAAAIETRPSPRALPAPPPSEATIPEAGPPPSARRNEVEGSGTRGAEPPAFRKRVSTRKPKPALAKRAAPSASDTVAVRNAAPPLGEDDAIDPFAPAAQ